MGFNSRWGSNVSISVLELGCIKIFNRWGCNQEWGFNQTYMVLFKSASKWGQVYCKSVPNPKYAIWNSDPERILTSKWSPHKHCKEWDEFSSFLACGSINKVRKWNENSNQGRLERKNMGQTFSFRHKTIRILCLWNLRHMPYNSL